MRLLCRYAGGLACLVTALALVACGGGPGTQPEPKQIGNITFQEGEKVRTIPLSDKFTGTDLTYSAESSNVRVATAMVDNEADTLTITAVGAGTATITVTAKNSQGEAKQPPFTVTVPPPASEEATPTVRTGAITSVPVAQGGAQAVTLSTVFTGANLSYTVLSSDTAVATASESNGTLTISGVSIGSATVTVTATNAAGSSPAHAIAVTVTVPPPASEEEAPTVRTGAITSVPVAQGGTQTVTLSTVFDGANLTYEVSSDAENVATASESGGTLTITGASIGPATITIVATNDAGTATHQIAVTVSEPATTPPITTTPTPTADNPKDCPTSPLQLSSLPLTLRIFIRGDHGKCTLPADHSLSYSATTPLVRARLSDAAKNEWTITALQKGRPVVQVRNNNTRETVGEITVIVPNTPPQLKPDTVGGSVFMNQVGTIAEKSTSPLLHSVTLTGIEDRFEDPDPTDNDEGDPPEPVLNYSVHRKPDELLIKDIRGFLFEDNLLPVDDANYTIDAVVLKPIESGFTIKVYAYDRENAQSDNPVTVDFNTATFTTVTRSDGTTFQAVEPRTVTYDVKQKANGDFVPPERIGNRLDVDHTLDFKDATGADDVGFVFASNLDTKLTKPDSAGKSNLGPPDTPIAPATDASYVEDDVICKGNKVPEKLPLGEACYTYTTSDKVEVSKTTAGAHAFTVADAGAEIDFRLPSSRNRLDGGSATITISYHVWAYTGKFDHSTESSRPRPEDVAADPDADPPTPFMRADAQRMYTDSEVLRLTIHKCVEATATGCP